MTPDQLRALADALIEYGEDAWPTPPEPIQRAADYLRAQADAEPVGWLHHVYLGDDLVDKAMLDTADPAQVPLGPNEVVRTVVPLFLRPVPQPQAEPKREPLHKLLEYADLSDDCQYGTLSASVVRDLVNEALGIGGSDAE